MIIEANPNHVKTFNPPGRNTWVEKKEQKGFPQDDENSLQQGDLGGHCDNLDIFYTHQFVQNESQGYDAREPLTYYIVEHTPVLPGTITGTIYVNQFAVQHLESRENGNIVLTKIGEPETFVEKASLNYVTGELKFEFNKVPGTHKIVLCYEFHMETNNGQ